MGRSHTHHRGVAGGRWKKRAPKTQRVFRPNLQVANLIVDGKVKRVKMCVRCMKRVKKDIRDGKKPFVVLASLKPKTEKKKVAKKSAKKASK